MATQETMQQVLEEKPNLAEAVEETFLLAGPPRNLREARLIYLPRNKYRTDVETDDLEPLVRDFKEWLADPLYLCFKSESGKLEFFRASKRGNFVYRNKLDRRIKEATTFFENSTFIDNFMLRNINGKYFSNVLFVSLTWDTKTFLGKRNEAWKSISYFYNVYITALRQRFGEIWALRTFESTQAGYPHVHLLLISKKPFECVQDNKGVWRIKNKSALEKCWNHFVDVKVPQNVESVKNYIMKDLFKQYNAPYPTPRDDLSLALNWLYRHQAVAISESSMFGDLIPLQRVLQMTTQDETEEIAAREHLKFLGLVCIFSFKGAPPPDVFSCRFNEEETAYLFSNMVKKSGAAHENL